MPPRQRDNDEERVHRIEALLEELRLNTEDMHELARQARERAIESRRQTRTAVHNARARRARKKR